MKRLLCVIILMAITVGYVRAQETEAFCPMHTTEQQQMKAKSMMTTFDGDGLHLTANGELKILVVFVRFPDDSENLSGDWWDAGEDPSILNSIIDVDTSVGSTNKYNLTHYFKEMSLDSYDVVGEAISVEAPQTIASYNYNLGDASKDVLDYISDNNLATFANYDNWTANGSADNDEVADDLVDMVVMVWKGSNFLTDETWGGCAAMYQGEVCASSGNPTESNPGTLAVNGGKDIEFGYEAGEGSGVTAFAYSDVRVAFNIMTHEIAHWLLGRGHPYYNGGYSDNRVASLLSATFTRSMSVNAAEQERLGWNTVPEITSDIRDTVLTDFLTTGAAFKYKVPPQYPPDPYNNEYFYFENRQNISIYDDATNDPDDKGIFILHTQYAIGNTHNIRYLASDGDWKWENIAPYTILAPCCGTVPLFTKVEPDRDYGKNYMAKLHATEVVNYQWLEGYKDEDGNSDVQGYFRGKENSDLKSTYNTNYGTIFAPHANPLPENGNGYINDFAMLIKGESNGVLTVDFIIDYDPYTITENTTWDGQIFLEETVNIENGATLTILPGTDVYIGDYKSITVRPGGKLLSQGTEEKPIHFQRLDPAKQWNRISLNSSEGNVIEWSNFTGGYINLSIASKNNTITHTTLNSAWRPLQGWHNQDGSGNASSTISYVHIKNSTSVGFVAQYINVDMSYTTISGSNDAGLYIYSGSVYPFHHNLITNNGFSRDGIEINSSGTLYMQESTYGYGYNEVSNNGKDQIASYGNLLIAPPPYLGNKRNSIHGDHDLSTEQLVENNTSNTVDAFYTWWGEHPTNSGMFDGPIDTYGALTSDPTNGVPHGAGGQVPAKALPSSNAADTRPVAEIYQELEEELEQAKNNQEVRDGMHRLYQLSDMSRKQHPELNERFRNLAKNTASGSNNLYSSASRNTTLRNTANVLQAKYLVKDGEFEKAKAWLSQTKADELDGYDRRD